MRVDGPQYRKDYNAGWRYSHSPNATLNHADAIGASEAWMDGYLDYAACRSKWHLLLCEGCEEHPKEV